MIQECKTIVNEKVEELEIKDAKKQLIGFWWKSDRERRHILSVLSKNKSNELQSK